MRKKKANIDRHLAEAHGQRGESFETMTGRNDAPDEVVAVSDAELEVEGLR